jgi:hypothetical protein
MPLGRWTLILCTGLAFACSIHMAAQTWEGSFTPTGSLVVARYDHTATLLTNGNALIVGGGTYNPFPPFSPTPLSSAELYNPATGTFSLPGSLNTARSNQTATLLTNGMVLTVGGIDNYGNPLSSAELYELRKCGLRGVAVRRHRGPQGPSC